MAALLAALLPFECDASEAIALPILRQFLAQTAALKVVPEEALVYRIAKQVQRQLAGRVTICSLPQAVRTVVAADVSYSKVQQRSYAVAIAWDVASAKIVERAEAIAPINFPYIPGLLSFREAPTLFAALRQLQTQPDVLLVDGQGLAHPRRFGVACHLGVLLDWPAIGCAKSRLCGWHAEVAPERGEWTELREGSACIGRVVRTRAHVKPVYVSVGHRATLAEASDLILQLARYRLPEPIRLADRLVGAMRAADESNGSQAGRQV